jgi:SAM-dependent methyltransferase
MRSCQSGCVLKQISHGLTAIWPSAKPAWPMHVSGKGPMADITPLVALGHITKIRRFFDRQYAVYERYWWREENRYSLELAAHTAYHAKVLSVAAQRGPGRALDLGAGEGADAIRLAKLGYHVDAVELSPVACEKIERFARTQGVRICVRNESLETVELPEACYDLVIMNGSLHYVRNKKRVLRRVLAASAADAGGGQLSRSPSPPSRSGSMSTAPETSRSAGYCPCWPARRFGWRTTRRPG